MQNGRLQKKRCFNTSNNQEFTHFCCDLARIKLTRFGRQCFSRFVHIYNNTKVWLLGQTPPGEIWIHVNNYIILMVFIHENRKGNWRCTWPEEVSREQRPLKTSFSAISEGFTSFLFQAVEQRWGMLPETAQHSDTYMKSLFPPHTKVSHQKLG